MDAAPGQGKTPLVAVLALYELFVGEDGAQVVVVATDERQAGLCFRAATRMVELNPELERRVQLFQDRMAIPSAARRFRSCPRSRSGWRDSTTRWPSWPRRAALTARSSRL